MDGTDELREALRIREVLAPDPEEVLAGTGRRIRRRRARRRALGAATLVAVTTVGLAAGLSWLRQDDGQPTLPVASPGAGEVVVPTLPFSLPEPGYEIVGWTIGARETSAMYRSSMRRGEVFRIVVEDHDPNPLLPLTRMTGYDFPVKVRPLAGGQGIAVSWQFGDGRWAVLGGSVVNDLPTLIGVAKSFRATPATPAAMIRSLKVPPSLRVVSWSWDPNDERLVLCPPRVEPADAQGTDGRCVSVEAALTTVLRGPETGVRQSLSTSAQPPSGPATITSSSSRPASATTRPGDAAGTATVVDGVPLRIAPDGRRVTRSFGEERRLVVTTGSGDQALLVPLAVSALPAG
ncbi:hypothetical protein FNH05_34955 [Amycolatopsis rhizosphaerae]|uniref:Uncharacterized protein n=1 Tax=Amycolatopsis rhizosphaerae TaxID=2053003 RepID=A0A558A5H3_9PSEU|nr:hypothetical protein [Amycolatopsis rhizosphaerae]TVT19478.1 hypothetical protein FNH05_34955 [Amycolatopsis rhizosphaerae]